LATRGPRAAPRTKGAAFGDKQRTGHFIVRAVRAQDCAVWARVLAGLPCVIEPVAADARCKGGAELLERLHLGPWTGFEFVPQRGAPVSRYLAFAPQVHDCGWLAQLFPHLAPETYIDHSEYLDAAGDEVWVCRRGPESVMVRGGDGPPGCDSYQRAVRPAVLGGRKAAFRVFVAWHGSGLVANLGAHVARDAKGDMQVIGPSTADWECWPEVFPRIRAACRELFVKVGGLVRSGELALWGLDFVLDEVAPDRCVLVSATTCPRLTPGDRAVWVDLWQEFVDLCVLPLGGARMPEPRNWVPTG